MWFELAYDNTEEVDRFSGWGFGIKSHVAEVTPLVEEISVNVYAVGFAEIFFDECADQREVFLFH